MADAKNKYPTGKSRPFDFILSYLLSLFSLLAGRLAVLQAKKGQEYWFVAAARKPGRTDERIKFVNMDTYQVRLNNGPSVLPSCWRGKLAR
jgi:hypothetical protein